MAASRDSEALKLCGLGCDKPEGHTYGWEAHSRFRNAVGIRLLISETQPHPSDLFLKADLR